MDVGKLAQVPSGIQGMSPVAKITRPNNADVVSRKRLFRLLDACLKLPVTWVSAPPGFGKTTLISSYLSCKKMPCIWYRVDAGDSDIATFFYYMRRAVEKAASREKIALPFLTPENLPGIQAFTLRFIEKLYCCLKPPFVIVFDNYQQTSFDSGFHEVIRHCLEVLPEGIHVILISREGPPSEFARLSVDRAISFMGADELRFTLEESLDLARLSGNGALSEDTLRLIHQRAHGWAAGILLLLEGTAGKGANPPLDEAQKPQRIFDYLASEVFLKMPVATQAFLLRVAFLPWMTVRMTEGLTGNKASGEILARLHAGHFFTEKDGGTDPVYRFHPLFREFLLSRGREVLPSDAIPMIQRQAAELLMDLGQDDEAAALLVSAGDWDGFISSLLNRAPSLMAQGRIRTLGDWLSRIPWGLVEKRPWLLYWSGVCKGVADPNEGRGCFEKAFELFCDRGDEPGILLSWAGAVDALIMAYDDFKALDRWIDWLEERTGSHPAYPSPEIEVAVAASMSGALLWRRPQHPAIKDWINRALRLSRDGRNVFQFLQSRMYALTYCTWIGDLAQGGIILDEMKAMADSGCASALTLLTCHVAGANFALLEDRYEETLRSASAGLALADQSGVHQVDFMLLGQGAYGALRKGDPELTAAYLGRMEACLQPGQLGTYAFYYNIAALQSLLTGDMSGAPVFAEKAFFLAAETGSASTVAMSRIVLAQAVFEAGDHGRAADELALGESFIRQMGSSFFEFTCGLVSAYFALRQGEETAGLAALAAALGLGRRKGFTYAPMLWRPAVWSLLCAKSLAAGIEVEYVRHLVRRQAICPEVPLTEIESWPWPVRIFTLGRFDLYLDENPVRFKGKAQKKPLQMLKAIISLGGKSVKKDRLMDLLWPEAEGDKAQSAFTSTLSRLRALIGSDPAIVVHEGAVSLNPRCCWVDAWGFEKLADQVQTRFKGGLAPAGERGGEDLASLAEKAIAMYGGAFLPGEDGQAWILPFREHLTLRFCRLVSSYGNYLEASGKWEQAAEHYRKVLALADSVDEEICQNIMMLYCRNGQSARAVEVYRTLSRTLGSTFGIKPSPKTEAIYKGLIGQSDRTP